MDKEKQYIYTQNIIQKKTKLLGKMQGECLNEAVALHKTEWYE